MRTSLVAFLVVLALAFTPIGYSTAHAQGLPLLGGPNALSVGLFLPTDGDARDDGSTNQYYIEAQYGLPVSVPFAASRTVINLAGEFGTNNGHHSNIIPLTIGEYFGVDGKSPNSTGNAFYGIGIGIYDEIVGSFSDTGYIGGYGAVGYNITSAIFVQAKYQVVQRADGPIVTAGLRF